MKQSKHIDILESSVDKAFFKYLAPSVSATIMISVNYFVDTLCIGQKLGEQGLAALNLSWPITTVLYSLGLLLGVGGGAMYSSYMARGETKKAQGAYTSALTVLMLAAALITLLGMVFLDPIVTVLGGTGEIKQDVTDYVKWVLVFSISYMGDCFYTSFLRNDGTPKLAMAGTLAACSLNIVLDIFFIYGLNAGMTGASLATSMAITVTILLGAGSTLRKKSGLKLRYSQFCLKEIVNIAKAGTATFLTEVDGGIVTFVYNTVLMNVAGASATTAIAVYGIVVNINTIVLAAINGISNAMQPLVSANHGAGKEKRANSFLSLAVKCGSIMAAAFVLVIEWKAEWFVKIFIEPDAAFLIQAVAAVRIVAVSYLLAAANMILICYFQAVRASVQAAFSTFLRTLILPVGYVIGGAVLLGVKGVWMASVCIEVTTICILLLSYRQYHKKITVKREREGETNG